MIISLCVVHLMQMEKALEYKVVVRYVFIVMKLLYDFSRSYILKAFFR